MRVEPRQSVRLKLLPRNRYRGVNEHDPIRFYYYPVFRRMYRRRVELCLGECRGGKSVLEVGFGSGLTFLNLHEMYRHIYGLDLSADVEEVSRTFASLGIRAELRNGSVLEMPYPKNSFDTVLLISILEHLKPEEQAQAFSEIRRVLKPNGQAVYGVPVERPFMVMMFKLLGYDIRQAHFSTECDVASAAGKLLQKVRIIQMKSTPPLFGTVYEVGHYIRT